MKIRTGFVSNSSSSSYIIVLDRDKETFLSDMVEAFEFGAFNVREVVYEIEEKLKQLVQAEVEAAKSVATLEWTKNHLEKSIESLDTLLKQIKELTEVHRVSNDVDYVCNTAVVELLLKDYYWISVEPRHGELKIIGSTTMHNSFADMPPVLKDILVYYLFTEDSAILSTIQKED